jgi:hypothetical protein
VRVVTKTATVSLAGNRYQVDPSLVGRRIELRYDPEDLTSLTVFVEGAAAGVATPLVIGRPTHPQVPQAARPAATPTGIDYLGLVQATHEDATIGHIADRALPLPGLEAPAPAEPTPTATTTKRGRSYVDEMVLDLGIYRNIQYVTHHTIHDVHKQLKKIADEVCRWSAPGSGVKVVSRKDEREDYALTVRRFRASPDRSLAPREAGESWARWGWRRLRDRMSRVLAIASEKIEPQE